MGNASEICRRTRNENTTQARQKSKNKIYDNTKTNSEMNHDTNAARRPERLLKKKDNARTQGQIAAAQTKQLKEEEDTGIWAVGRGNDFLKVTTWHKARKKSEGRKEKIVLQAVLATWVRVSAGKQIREPSHTP